MSVIYILGFFALCKCAVFLAAGDADAFGASANHLITLVAIGIATLEIKREIKR